MKTKEIPENFQPGEMDPPLPARRPGEESFRVPEGYFHDLPGRIQDKIISARNEEGAFAWFLKLVLARKVWIPALVTACLLIALFIFLPGQKASQPLAASADTLGLKAAYDASYAGETYNAEFAEIDKVMSDPTFDTGSSISFIHTSDPEITGESILDYLQDQELDPELLAQL